MIGSILTHPTLLAKLWGAWVEIGRLPKRLPFGLSKIDTPEGVRQVVQRDLYETSFEALSVFERADRRPESSVLLAPPFSGGYPFMMRDVVARFAVDRRVYVLEWANARFARPECGHFYFEDQIAAVARALETIGEPAHLLALCQGGPAAFAAAVMRAQGGAPPASVTLMASPIDAHIAPSPLSAKLAELPYSFFARRMLRRSVVGGGSRMVAPAEGFLRTLMSTLSAQRIERDEFSQLILEDLERPEPNFFTIVSSFMDVPAEFFLDWVERVYLRPRPLLSFQDQPLDRRALADTPLIVVEGAEDGVAAPGQTAAALQLAPSDRALRHRLSVEGAGHFSLFYGPRWREKVEPRLAPLIDAVETVGA